MDRVMLVGMCPYVEVLACGCDSTAVEVLGLGVLRDDLRVWQAATTNTNPSIWMATLIIFYLVDYGVLKDRPKE